MVVQQTPKKGLCKLLLLPFLTEKRTSLIATTSGFIFRTDPLDGPQTLANAWLSPAAIFYVHWLCPPTEETKREKGTWPHSPARPGVSLNFQENGCNLLCPALHCLHLLCSALHLLSPALPCTACIYFALHCTALPCMPCMHWLPLPE